MNLLFLIFGDNPDNHYQANFSIRSFYLQREYLNKIHILTDRPEYYYCFRNDDLVVVEQVSEKTIREWRGPQDYIYRVKIKALQYSAAKFNDQALLYLDNDTFLFGDLGEIAKNLERGCSLMHLNQGLIAESDSKSEKIIWKQAENRSFVGIRVNDKHAMWNAGVIGIPKGNLKKNIDLALEVCDEMCQVIDRQWFVEQFSVSLVLSETARLLPADHCIAHYWGNKEGWNDFITDFFARSHLFNLTFEEELSLLGSLHLEEVPIIIEVSSTRNRLVNLITNLFPERNRTYISSEGMVRKKK